MDYTWSTIKGEYYISAGEVVKAIDDLHNRYCKDHLNIDSTDYRDQLKALGAICALQELRDLLEVDYG